jgi:hypothetical protein
MPCTQYRALGLRWERRVQKQCRHFLLAAVGLLTTATGVAKPALAQINSLSFKGFNYVSYYNGGYANADSLPALAGTGANAAALAFEYGIDVNNSAVYADANYTESQSVIAATIAEANSRGLSVMVRPLLDFLDPSKIGSYSVGDWRSTYNPANAAAFFASYKTMIVAIAQVAQTNGATSLSIGAELDQLTGPVYLSYWTDIITSVRAVFSGKLTYSADWDDKISPWQGQHGLTAGTGDLTTQVSFWSQLDYLGIDCYAPLSDAANPTLANLIAGWTQTPSDPTSLSVTGNQSLISYFASVATQAGKPLVFTEIGYESANDAAKQPSGTSTNIYDPSLQANLYGAFFEAWQQNGNNSLLGVYFWNWDPNAAEVGPGNGPNFSPQGQPAQAVVTANFSAPLPALQVTPATNIASSGNQGGPFSPSSFQYQLQATTGSVGYSISGVPSWLTASSTSGTVSTSATVVTFTINSGANTLSPATYNATITFTDTTNNNTVQTTTAALTVNVLNPPINYTLSVSVSGNGTVTSSPGGINCGATCSASFASATQVTLTATPATGSSFNDWSGACNGTSTCSVAMNAAESVAANFASDGVQASQTWVSATSGTDSNPCTRASPCLTFAAALAQTTAGGEINCLDAGGFGALTITKSISLLCDSSGEAGVLVSGTNGISVNALSTDVVYIKGIDFEGLNASPNGIQINTAAKVSIVNCRVRGFTTAGIGVTNSTSGILVNVVDSILADNPGEGIQAIPSGSVGTRVMITRTRALNNGGDGFMANGTMTTSAAGLRMTIRDSESANNGGDGFVAFTAGTIVQMMIDSSVSHNNNRGINASGTGATVRFTRSSITANAIGANQVGAGSALSYQTNSVDGNGTNGTFGTTSQQ